MQWLEYVVFLQLVTTWWMVGLIWFVQIVHYPLMASVGESNFADYEYAHTRLTGLVVGPAMLLEAFSAITIIYLRPIDIEAYCSWIGFGLILMIWLITAFFSVPMHRRLEKGFDRKAHRRLVQSNWFRTLGWSLRGILVIWISWQVFVG
jgi:uncharacterized membrane protein